MISADLWRREILSGATGTLGCFPPDDDYAHKRTQPRVVRCKRINLSVGLQLPEYVVNEF